jgi:hypothetical protein
MPQRASVFCNFYIRVDREALVSERALDVGSVAFKAMSTKIKQSKTFLKKMHLHGMPVSLPNHTLPNQTKTLKKFEKKKIWLFLEHIAYGYLKIFSISRKCINSCCKGIDI